MKEKQSANRPAEKAEQYFTQSPTAQHDYRTFVWELDWCTLKMTTDSGVFSKGEADHGSVTLLGALPEAREVLDLGCGYGAVGIAYKLRFPNANVTMTDVNRRALDLAQRNADANRLPRRKLGAPAGQGENGSSPLLIGESDGFSALEGRSFDLIATNPPIRAGKSVYFPWVQQAYDHLVPGGRFYAVIRKKQGSDTYAKLMKDVFGNCETVERSKGFHVLVSQKQ